MTSGSRSCAATQQEIPAIEAQRLFGPANNLKPVAPPQVAKALSAHELRLSTARRTLRPRCQLPMNPEELRSGPPRQVLSVTCLRRLNHKLARAVDSQLKGCSPWAAPYLKHEALNFQGLHHDRVRLSWFS